MVEVMGLEPTNLLTASLAFGVWRGLRIPRNAPLTSTDALSSMFALVGDLLSPMRN